MGTGQNFLTWVGSGRVSHLWFEFEFEKFPPKNVKFFTFFPFGLKKFLRVGSKSTRVKGGSASYLRRVKSKLGSGQDPSLGRGNKICKGRQQYYRIPTGLNKYLRTLIFWVTLESRFTVIGYKIKTNPKTCQLFSPQKVQIHIYSLKDIFFLYLVIGKIIPKIFIFYRYSL